MTHLPATLGALFLGAVASFPAVAQEPGRTFSPGQMEEDLFTLFDTLQAQHGGLCRYASPEEIEEAFGDAMLAVAEEASAIEFYRTVAALLTTIRCGHTSARPGGRDQTALLARRGLLPLEMMMRGERMWVTRPLGDDVPVAAGSEVRAIDGLSIAEIRRRAFSRMSGDGFIETGKERSLERSFALRYLLVAADLEREGAYRVEIVGNDEPFELPGFAPSAYERLRSRPPRGPLVDLSLLPGHVGHLSVRQFGDPGGGAPSFPDSLAVAFARLLDEGVETLVLDLRGNGGGDDMYGALLVSYLTDEPFGYFDRIEVTADYEGYGDVVERDGRRLVTAHPALQVQQPAEHAFPGEVFLLVDGRTFSTAADVATVAHHLDLATLVGEETGGGYDGNTSGVSRSLTLPNSGIMVNVPCWMYTTANVGHDRPGRGAPAVHEVHASIDDVLAGRDAVLEFVLDLARGD